MFYKKRYDTEICLKETTSISEECQNNPEFLLRANRLPKDNKIIILFTNTQLLKEPLKIEGYSLELSQRKKGK